MMNKMQKRQTSAMLRSSMAGAAGASVGVCEGGDGLDYSGPAVRCGGGDGMDTDERRCRTGGGEWW